MKTKLVAALFTALSASLAAPAFASGYGPAPFYQPLNGAPSSQRGPSAQTLAAERGDAGQTRQDHGGVAEEHAQSGTRAAMTLSSDLYAHH